jgi:hypothetical protein
MSAGIPSHLLLWSMSRVLKYITWSGPGSLPGSGFNVHAKSLQIFSVRIPNEKSKPAWEPEPYSCPTASEAL